MSPDLRSERSLNLSLEIMEPFAKPFLQISLWQGRNEIYILCMISLSFAEPESVSFWPNECSRDGCLDC